MTFLPPIGRMPHFSALPLFSGSISDLSRSMHLEAQSPNSSPSTTKTVAVVRDILPSLIPDQPSPLVGEFKPSPMRVLNPPRAASRSPKAETLSSQASLQPAVPVSMGMLSSPGRTPSRSFYSREVFMLPPRSPVSSLTQPSPSFDLPPTRTLPRCVASKVLPPLMKGPMGGAFEHAHASVIGSVEVDLAGMSISKLPPCIDEHVSVETPVDSELDLPPILTLSRCVASKVLPPLMKGPKGGSFGEEHAPASVVDLVEVDLAGMSVSKLPPCRDECVSVESPVDSEPARSLGESSSATSSLSVRHKNSPTQDYLEMAYDEQVKVFMHSCVEFEYQRRRFQDNHAPTDILFFHQERTKQLSREEL